MTQTKKRPRPSRARDAVITHRIPRATLAVLTTLTLVVLSLGAPHLSYAFNGYLEDCDFDAYDDETHAPVPWYGFDETKGDTVPADWDGVAGSYVFKPSPASDANSTSDAGDTASNPASVAGSSNSTQSQTVVVESSDSVAASVLDNQEAANTANSAEEVLPDASTPLANLSPLVQAIVGVKGTLDIAPESGSRYTPGSALVIRGAGFAGSVEELKLNLGALDPQTLARVSTSADGSFEASVTLPETLEPGKHDIVVFYGDYPIVKRTIDVVDLASAPDSTTDSLFVGLILLAGLAFIGIGVLLGWRATKKKRLAGRAPESTG
ncbi:MAG: hypothetical protein LBJ48_02925 [Coriobacteriales bacterium]|jgi:hypothetical protein|nr:hypothetical protein [Coriobacteriales bacterium]